jgi:GH25 family lysozyme M1 (1,4-beta-N-acetylmuramidase)
MFKKPVIKYNGVIPKPLLKIGNKGNAVKDLQKFLNWYLTGKLVIDGEFGPKTKKALISFQKYEKLVKDGEYGDKSYAKAKSYKKQEEKSKSSMSYIVDVSYWQHDIDWNKVKKDDIAGAILRTSYTSQRSFSLSKDSTFEKNIKNAKKAGLYIGAYHYSQAISVKEAVKEAKYMCKILKPYKNDIKLPVVCDWEFGIRLDGRKAKSLGKAKCTEIVNAFCKEVKKQGFAPMVYANYMTFSNYLNTSKIKENDYLIWLAQYASKASMDYDMWQYSSNGKVAGIKNRVDVNKAKQTIFIKK